MQNDLEFLDVLNIVSFVVGLMNYQENLTQTDKQDLMSEVDNKTKLALNEIQKHLEEQDKKIDRILEALNETDKKIS